MKRTILRWKFKSRKVKSRPKNNFVGPLKLLYRIFKLIPRISKLFAALLIMLEIILMAQQNYSDIYLANFLDSLTQNCSFCEDYEKRKSFMKY